MNSKLLQILIVGICVDMGLTAIHRQDRVTTVRSKLGKRTTEAPVNVQVIGYRNQDEGEPAVNSEYLNQPGIQTGDIEMVLQSLPIIKSLQKPKFFYQASPVRPKNAYVAELETVYYFDV